MSIIYCDAKRIGYNLYSIGYCDELMFEGHVEMFKGDNNEAELKAVQLGLVKYPGAGSCASVLIDKNCFSY